MHQEMAALNQAGSSFPLRSRYGNFVGGEWLAPSTNAFVDNISPITGRKTCEIPASARADVELALRAAENARQSWKKTPAAWRARALSRIADRLEANCELLAVAEGRDHGGPMTNTWSIVLAVDHFRYFASRLRETKGGPTASARESEFPDHNRGPAPEAEAAAIDPAQHPVLAAVWQLAPALAAGSCVVLRPAHPVPSSVLVLVDLIRDLLPPGVLNLVLGYGLSPAARAAEG